MGKERALSSAFAITSPVFTLSPILTAVTEGAPIDWESDIFTLLGFQSSSQRGALMLYFSISSLPISLDMGICRQVLSSRTLSGDSSFVNSIPLGFSLDLYMPISIAGLRPCGQAYISHTPQPEQYWVLRSALVSAMFEVIDFIKSAGLIG